MPLFRQPGTYQGRVSLVAEAKACVRLGATKSAYRRITRTCVFGAAIFLLRLPQTTYGQRNEGILVPGSRCSTSISRVGTDKARRYPLRILWMMRYGACKCKPIVTMDVNAAVARYTCQAQPTCSVYIRCILICVHLTAGS